MTWRSPGPRHEDTGSRMGSDGDAQPAGARTTSGDARGGPVNLLVAVNDMSQVGAARRAAIAIASDIDMSEEGVSTVAIVATELAGNLARHAQSGFISLRALESAGECGLEILSFDHGPGIPDVDAALRDGFSTRGTPGKGLGAVARMATEFDVWSSTKAIVSVSGLAAAAARGTAGPLGVGSVILARLWRTARGIEPPRTPLRREPGVVCAPFPGESVCGDAWLVTQRPAATTLIVVDGLGHGRDAAIAADAAIRCSRGVVDEAPAEIIRTAHAALRATRGAAMAVARIDHASRSVQFAGIGNIAGTIMAGGFSKGLASGNGIVGHQFGHVHEFAYEWPSGAYLVMHTDGLSGRWQADAYASALGHDPSLLAASLYRDYARAHDDQTVLVISDAIAREMDR